MVYVFWFCVFIVLLHHLFIFKSISPTKALYTLDSEGTVIYFFNLLVVIVGILYIILS